MGAAAGAGGVCPKAVAANRTAVAARHNGRNTRPYYCFRRARSTTEATTPPLSPESRTPVRRRVVLLLSLAAGLLVQLLSAAVVSETRPAAEINKVLKAQAEAWNRGDIDGYMEGYARAETTQFVSGDTVTRGWETVRNRYKAKYDSREKMGVLSFADIKVTELGPDAAMAVGRWRLTRKGDKPRGRFTLLLRRTPEGWRSVHDHTSSATS